MNYRILIVDDSPLIRAVISRAVQQIGISKDGIREAGNGQEALDALATETADLILLDLNMPVMDGRAFMAAKNATADIKEIGVIVVTTEGNAKRLHELRDLGVHGFLHKPFEPEALRTLVGEVLGT